MKTLMYSFNILCNKTDLSIQEPPWYDDIDAPFGGQKKQNMSRDKSEQESSTIIL
jgi:hypothetical protein